MSRSWGTWTEKWGVKPGHGALHRWPIPQTGLGIPCPPPATAAGPLPGSNSPRQSRRSTLRRPRTPSAPPPAAGAPLPCWAGSSSPGPGERRPPGVGESGSGLRQTGPAPQRLQALCWALRVGGIQTHLLSLEDPQAHCLKAIESTAVGVLRGSSPIRPEKGGSGRGSRRWHLSGS